MRIAGGLAPANLIESIPTDPCVSLRSAAEQRGIIVIGGAQAQPAADAVRDAAMKGPLLQGIIIVGGSPVQPHQAAEFEIQALMSQYNSDA